MNKTELDRLSAELVAAIYKPVLELGGRIDHLHLEITGVDTHTGDPIHIRIGHETIADNWPTGPST